MSRSTSTLVCLPHSANLPVQRLAAVFNQVTNSYKFYWFLAVLERAQSDHGRIMLVDELLTEMVALAWYPTNMFRLSLGKQDQLNDIPLRLREARGLAPYERPAIVQRAALEELHDGRSAVGGQIRNLGVYVPRRFLTPFFEAELRGRKDAEKNRLIERLADEAFADGEQPALYRFVADGGRPAIEFHPGWYGYFRTHARILKDFCLWNLLLYVQKNNPNVPNLAAKLFEPGVRDMSRARRYWEAALEVLGPQPCIYSGVLVGRGAYSLDHFLPWSYVAHDLLWNIAPTTASVNSAKGDRVPELGRYFGDFARLQYEVLQVSATAARAKLVEDYTLLFKVSSLEELRAVALGRFEATLYDTISPQVQIAENLGFVTGWRY